MFRMDPSVQDYFPEFKGKNEEELRGLFSFETQSTLMINIFDEVVEKLDDMDSVINLLQKTAEKHRQMGITADVFRVRYSRYQPIYIDEPPKTLLHSFHYTIIDHAVLIESLG